MALTPRQQQLLAATMQAALEQASAGVLDLDADQQEQLQKLFEQAGEKIAEIIKRQADGSGQISGAVLPLITSEIVATLEALRVAETALVEQALASAATNGAQVITVIQSVVGAGALPAAVITAYPTVSGASSQVLQQVLHGQAVDGLTLSDRIWRNHRGIREELLPKIQAAVSRGESAREAARRAVATGAGLDPAELDRIELARAGALGDEAKQVLASPNAAALSNAKRVMRTEMDRANIMATRAVIFATEGVIGTRFMLSPRHPRYDVCDMHARLNLYGLGAGVYPPGKSPLPAHPNTLSFEEAVFEWEVSDDDRVQIHNPLDWLRSRTPAEQFGVLQADGKVQALQHGLLEFDEVTLPWRILQPKYAPLLSAR